MNETSEFIPLIPQYIKYAIPLFSVTIVIEFILAKRRGKQDHYRANDTINNLTMGIFSQITDILAGLTLFLTYALIYQSYRLFTLENAWYIWVLCYIAHDFLYYLFHLISHKVNIIWGSHEPHHSSEEFNYSVALRQGAFQTFFSSPIFFSLAILGFDPVMWLICGQLNLIFQFLPHTRLIGKMWGPIEFIFSTPSHHRVHHAKNPKYIDKNFGGTFIIWDRMFGTFKEEEDNEVPVYGIITPLKSWNPVWGQVKNWVMLFKRFWSMPGLLNKLKVLFLNPSWTPSGQSTTPEVSMQTYEKYDQGVKGLYRNIYLIISFLFCSNTFLYFDLFVTSDLDKGLTISFLIVSLLSVGILLNNPSWAKKLEVIRIVTCTLIGLFYAFFILQSTLASVFISSSGLLFLALFYYLFQKGSSKGSPS